MLKLTIYKVEKWLPTAKTLVGGLGLAELVKKAEFDQLGLQLWLNWSLEDFPGGVGWCGGGGEKLGMKLKLSFSWGLGLAELGKN